MNEEVITRLFAYHTAHKTLLNALIASHPQPEFLLKALRHYAEAPNIAMLNSSFPEKHITQYEEELNSFIALTEKYIQNAAEARE
jgi:hypothetical protein